MAYSAQYNAQCITCNYTNSPNAAFCARCGSSLSPLSSSLHTVVAAPPTIESTGREATTAAPHLLNGRYRFIKVLGKGGMGAVYKAEDTVQFKGRVLAIKEMLQHGMSYEAINESARNFRQEAELLANLMHPNLPRIYDHFTTNGGYYLVMDYIEGETVADYLAKSHQQRLPVAEVMEIGIELCSALEYLHTHQPPIIFRDLKPQNVMRSNNGHLYLIDFGIARFFKQGQSQDTMVALTPGYAAPEQGGREQTTPRADIYSLGAMLHQMLTGNNPSVTPFIFSPPVAYDSTIPLELSNLIMQMLEIKKENRPGSITDVKQMLKRLQNQPAARPTGFVLPSLKSNTSTVPNTGPHTTGSHLGRSIPPLSVPTMACPGCNSLITINSMFCNVCGYQLNSTGAMLQKPPTTHPGPTSPRRKPSQVQPETKPPYVPPPPVYEPPQPVRPRTPNPGGAWLSSAIGTIFLIAGTGTAMLLLLLLALSFMPKNASTATNTTIAFFTLGIIAVSAVSLVVGEVLGSWRGGLAVLLFLVESLLIGIGSTAQSVLAKASPSIPTATVIGGALIVVPLSSAIVGFFADRADPNRTRTNPGCFVVIGVMLPGAVALPLASALLAKVSLDTKAWESIASAAVLITIPSALLGTFFWGTRRLIRK